MTKKPFVLPIGIALFAAVLVGYWALDSESVSVESRQVLSDQLRAAYPRERAASGAIREFDIVAAPATVELADELSVDVWAYNETVPGPELRVELGDTVVATLRNDLPEATSIHWHGVRVPNDMDGVSGVNQVPVPPGESFRYEFVPKDAGTFWFHSHTRGSEQLERGLYGSLVVEDPAEPAYDRDLVWIVDDWLLEDTGALVERFNVPHDVSHNGRWGNVVTMNGQINAVVDAQPGERLRLRVINASNARVVAPTFDGVYSDVIAVDGMLARTPSDGDAFVLAPGNRVDLDITMPPTPGSVAVRENFNGEGFAIATLNVRGESIETASFAAPVNDAIPDLVTEAVGIDQEYSLDFLPAQMMSPRWGFNGRTFDDADTFTTSVGDLETIRLRNDSQALHPIHIHGQFFKVLAADGDVIDEPYLRDTVLVYPGQTVDIAMVASDVGVWAVHCHIQEHADAGMMTLLEVTA